MGLIVRSRAGHWPGADGAQARHPVIGDGEPLVVSARRAAGRGGNSLRGVVNSGQTLGREAATGRTIILHARVTLVANDITDCFYCRLALGLRRVMGAANLVFPDNVPKYLYSLF